MADADPGLDLAKAFDRVFAHGDGAAVLEHLMRLFRAQTIYTPGGLEGQRETDRRAAQKEVVDYILRLMARAQGGDPNDV